MTNNTSCAHYFYVDYNTISTLKLQPHWTFSHGVITLAPKRVTVPMDGSPPQNVNFRGCKIMQLQAGGRKEGDDDRIIMMPLFTIGGPCFYTKEDKKDFEIMMRTKQQSLCMHLPFNGEFDWPVSWELFLCCFLFISMYI